MTIKSQNLSDTSWYSLIQRIEGIVELLLFEHDIVSITTAATHTHGFYGAVFYRVKEK